jgi:hypothetical protein
VGDDFIFVMGDIPFARCVKSPARSRAFPAAGGIRIPETRPCGPQIPPGREKFLASPALRSAETGPRRFHKAPPGTSPIPHMLDFDVVLSRRSKPFDSTLTRKDTDDRGQGFADDGAGDQCC